MGQINYTITKIGDDDGAGIYEVKYAYVTEAKSLVQKEELILTKEDASGAVVEDRLEVPASSIVSYTDLSSTTATKGKKNGFAINVSDSNLAIGGVYYDVESTSGRYVNPNTSSSSTPMDFYIEPNG